MRIGLRVDVDTLRGTLRGLPALVALLDRLGASGSFFLSVGPDNMGRHLWRLVRPSFLAKMVRTRAPALYGWDILIRGTVVPGPIIGRRAAAAIREAARSGHEIGLHAWDHHGWQSRIERLDGVEIADHLRRGIDLLEELTDSPVRCSAAPAWRVTDAALREKARLPLVYNSDCRGTEPFVPLLDDDTPGQLQLPATLPTFDERVGPGTSAAGYYDELLAALERTRDRDRPEFEVLTIHAEVEGIAALPLFEHFARQAMAAGHRFVALGELAAEVVDAPIHRMSRREIPGREGWVSWQGERAGTPAVRLAAGACG